MKLWRLALYLSILSLFNSCSSITSTPSSDHKLLNFLDFERLEIGKATMPGTEQLLGRPDQTVAPSPDEQVWSYSDGISENRYQRLNLVFDKKSGLLASATWVPRDDEPLAQLGQALAYFKTLRFVKHSAGWISKHAYSSEGYYQDIEAGVSIYYSDVTGSALAISFSKPLAERRLSNQAR